MMIIELQEWLIPDMNYGRKEKLNPGSRVPSFVQSIPESPIVGKTPLGESCPRQVAILREGISISSSTCKGVGKFITKHTRVPPDPA